VKPRNITGADSAEASRAPREPEPEPVILIIADISGYTRYMTANAKTLAHSQIIITELILAIIKQVELPIEVAKLEGDAVFLYCRKQNSSQSWPDTRKTIGDKLFSFFAMFERKVGELSRSTTCHCSACLHIEKLRLKLIVHSGEALFHQVLQFLELAGVDVIIVHRLLKNSVNSDQYLLLTEAARQNIDLPEQVHLVAGVETYDDLGPINTLVYLPEEVRSGLDQNAASNRSQAASGISQGAAGHQPADLAGLPFGARFGKSWKLFCKLWFAPLVSRSGRPAFQHLVSGTGPAGRASFALLTFLLTPLYFPIGTLFVLFHALKAPSGSNHRSDGREHTADGSCCR